MLYFTTETLSHGEKSIYYLTTRAREGLRTENIRLTTGFLQAGHASGGAYLKTSIRADLHNRAWIRLASVLKSDTPCNS